MEAEIMEREETIKVKPLSPVAAIWERDISIYPDIIKIPMEDGHVITYRMEVQQPAPQVIKTLELIRIMNHCAYGGYKGKRRRSERNV